MTKPMKLAIGVGSACVVFAALALGLDGPAAWVCGWVALACGLASFAYLANRPAVFGKRSGRIPWWRQVPLLPYQVAYGIGRVVRRHHLAGPPWDEVAPGLYVGARVGADELPADVQVIVDLTSESSAPAALRSRPGYRSLPVLDGAHPHDECAFLELVGEILETPGGVYIHCETGIGRAPTAAAALLMARRVVADPEAAVEMVKKGRPVARPTRSDLRFLERIAARLGPR